MIVKNILNIDGRRITKIEAGKGKAIVLIPGMGCDVSLWTYVVPLLAKHFHVYAFSIPAYRTYNNKGRRFTIRTYHQLLEKLVKRNQIKKPVLVGHSLGAIICTKYAIKHPRSVDKLVLVSAPFVDHSKPLPLSWRLAVKAALKIKKVDHVIEYISQHETLIKHLCEVIMPKREVERSIGSFTELLKSVPAKSMAYCYHDLFRLNFRKDLEKITQPTVFIYGENDTSLHLAHATLLYNLVVNAKIVSLPSGHFVAKDCPKKLSRVIIDFIKS